MFDWIKRFFSGGKEPVEPPPFGDEFAPELKLDFEAMDSMGSEQLRKYRENILRERMRAHERDMEG